VVRWHIIPHLLPNHYHIGISVSQIGLGVFWYDRRVKALTMCVDSDSTAQGIVDMEPRMEIVGPGRKNPLVTINK
jgi:hypothetical protein